MADGTVKPIADVRVGDEVLATDPESGETVPKKVEAVFVNLDEDLADIELVAGSLAEVVKSTPHHEIWSETRKRWVGVGDLAPGEHLHSVGAVPAVVRDVVLSSGPRFMWDLTVADVHTYYVSAANTSVLVHNCGGRPSGPDPNGNIVYRALAEGEGPATGLTARDPSAAGVSPLSHVAGKRNTPWISTSKNPDIAFDKYNNGYGVVAIDLSRIPYSYVDISSGPFPSSRRHSSYARKDSEVLIWQRVPAEAIVGYWPGR